MSGGLTGLAGLGISTGASDFHRGMTAPGLHSIFLETERQKLQLLRQLTLLSASSQALESITSLHQLQHQTQQLYRPRVLDHVLDRQVLSDLLARFASPGIVAMQQSNPLERCASRQAAQASGTTQPDFPRGDSDATVEAKAVVSSASHVQRIAAYQAPGVGRPPAKRLGRSSVFPRVLHAILADLERQGRDDIASFLPHGRAFAIHKPREFATKVLPRYFRMGHFTSFQRQLNLYDFQRVTRGEDKVRRHVHVSAGWGKPLQSVRTVRIGGSLTLTFSMASTLRPTE